MSDGNAKVNVDEIARQVWLAVLDEQRNESELHHGCEGAPPDECALYCVIHEAIWTASVDPSRERELVE